MLLQIAIFEYFVQVLMLLQVKVQPLMKSYLPLMLFSVQLELVLVQLLAGILPFASGPASEPSSVTASWLGIVEAMEEPLLVAGVVADRILGTSVA